MQTYYDAKEMLHDELAKIVKKGELSAGSLDTVDKLLNSISHACKIIMYEQYDDGEYSRDTMTSAGNMNTGSSYARTHRDSRGRYARDGRGNSYNYSRGYSYADDKYETIEVLRGLMDEVSTDEERAVLKKLIRRMDQN